MISAYNSRNDTDRGKQTYSDTKTDLLRQKHRPTQTQKQTYSDTKTDLIRQKNRPTQTQKQT